MREFFRGWRRKLGCVTLVMACVCLVMSMRGRLRFDSVYLNRPQSLYIISSIDQRLSLVRTDCPNEGQPLVNWITLENSQVKGFSWDESRRQFDFDPFGNELVEWRYDWCGFQAGAYRDRATPSHRVQLCMIPFWALTLAATLVSAYLILWKPRKRT